jgi:hypothetical protein
MVNLNPSKLVVKLASEIKIADHAKGTLKSATPSTIARDSTSELVTFVGYLGGQVTYDSTPWRILYLDWALQSCLLVQESGIVHSEIIKPTDAPFNEQNVIWVRHDTPVGRSSGSLPKDAQFLSGDFTRAGDVEAGPTGGTLSAATGVFCEARSPGCCRNCTGVTR